MIRNYVYHNSLFEARINFNVIAPQTRYEVTGRYLEIQPINETNTSGRDSMLKTTSLPCCIHDVYILFTEYINIMFNIPTHLVVANIIIKIKLFCRFGFRPSL